MQEKSKQEISYLKTYIHIIYIYILYTYNIYIYIYVYLNRKYMGY